MGSNLFDPDIGILTIWKKYKESSNVSLDNWEKETLEWKWGLDSSITNPVTEAIKDMLVQESFQKGAGGNIRHDENIDRIINGIKSIIQNNPDIGAMNAMKMYIEMVGSDFDRWLETESPEPVGAR